MLWSLSRRRRGCVYNFHTTFIAEKVKEKTRTGLLSFGAHDDSWDGYWVSSLFGKYTAPRGRGDPIFGTLYRWMPLNCNQKEQSSQVLLKTKVPLNYLFGSLQCYWVPMKKNNFWGIIRPPWAKMAPDLTPVIGWGIRTLICKNCVPKSFRKKVSLKRKAYILMVSGLEPARPSWMVGGIVDFYFLNMPALRSFDMLYMGLRRVKVPWFGVKATNRFQMADVGISTKFIFQMPVIFFLLFLSL